MRISFHWHAAQWFAAIWILLGLTGIFFVKDKPARIIGNIFATVVWISILWWGGFWS